MEVRATHCWSEESFGRATPLSIFDRLLAVAETCKFFLMTEVLIDKCFWVILELVLRYMYLPVCEGPLQSTVW